MEPLLQKIPLQPLLIAPKEALTRGMTLVRKEMLITNAKNVGHWLNRKTHPQLLIALLVRHIHGINFNQIFMEKESEEIFTKDIFRLGLIRVPAYQRAFAWEEPQLIQFVGDLKECNDLKEFNKNVPYYFGHFILEKSGSGVFEIIDGQQRLTTLILFLMVCNLYKPNPVYEKIFAGFETVNYDESNLKQIQKNIRSQDLEWQLEDFDLSETLNPTLSLKRILFALNFFKNSFKNYKNRKAELFDDFIDDYAAILIDARISYQITLGKAVAVQIFELQNTRGIQLNTIEKVKAKLMKAVYKYSEFEKADENICKIQNEFALIYQLEERTTENSFRGELKLDELLLSHLRVIDNGDKIKIDTNPVKLNSPARGGNREEQIIKYLDEKLYSSENTNGPSSVLYAIKLSEEFRKSIELFADVLPEIDKVNNLIGDVLLFEKDLSSEFFMIISRLPTFVLSDHELLKKWEKFLFNRDFHDKYYGRSIRDKFQDFFIDLVIHDKNKENEYEKRYQLGFRPELMDSKSLQKTVNEFISYNKNNILEKAYYWWQEKMVYVLYKFEKEKKNTNKEYLRLTIKEGRSIEHILPREYSHWIGGKTEDEKKDLINAIEKYINGIGNLLLISKSENSSLSNNHPKDKEYKNIGGTYELHNLTRDRWNDYENWSTIIDERGEEIFNFIEAYFLNETE